ncbi:MAG: hypothetical protein NXI01_07945 [Gammaproteobacteria bacterium]|nr:hypothetical protein [Gammaproteobacteria bacterium]
MHAFTIPVETLVVNTQENLQQLQDERTVLKQLIAVYNTDSYPEYEARYNTFRRNNRFDFSALLDTIDLSEEDLQDEINIILSALRLSTSIDRQKLTLTTLINKLNASLRQETSIILEDPDCLKAFRLLILKLKLRRGEKLIHHLQQPLVRENMVAGIILTTTGLGALGFSFAIGTVLPPIVFIAILVVSGINLLAAGIHFVRTTQNYSLSTKPTAAIAEASLMLGGYVSTFLATQTYLSASFSAQFALLIGVPQLLLLWA